MLRKGRKLLLRCLCLALVAGQGGSVTAKEAKQLEGAEGLEETSFSLAPSDLCLRWSGEDEVTLTWRGCEGALEYEVQGRCGQDFLWRSYGSVQAPDCSLVIKDLPRGRAAFRVRAVYPGGEKSGYSKTAASRREEDEENGSRQSIQEEGQQVTLSYPGLDGEEVTYEAVFEEDWFRVSAALENPSLAYLSCLGAASTYSQEGSEKAFLEECGFTVALERKSQSSFSDNDHARFVAGYRVLGDEEAERKKGAEGEEPEAAGSKAVVEEKEILIALVISGYNERGFEWISNFRLGSGKVHEGFALAAGEVYEALRELEADLSKTYPGASFRYWLMGHSRGGAITNILSETLTEETSEGEDRVYGYAFATPRLSKKVAGKRFPNIRNLLLPRDPVPDVAPALWGYRRYGRDVFLGGGSSLWGVFFPLVGKDVEEHDIRSYLEVLQQE